MIYLGIIALATFAKIPISTTHAIGGAVSGVGATRRIHTVRWLWRKSGLRMDLYLSRRRFDRGARLLPCSPRDLSTIAPENR
jgi:hypothetical protein